MMPFMFSTIHFPNLNKTDESNRSNIIFKRLVCLFNNKI